MAIEALLPLNVEKRHDFYGYPFYIGVHDNDVENEQDRLALSQINKVFRNLLNSKYLYIIFLLHLLLLFLLYLHTNFWFFVLLIN